jgi:hypothetical protein
VPAASAAAEATPRASRPPTGKLWRETPFPVATFVTQIRHLQPLQPQKCHSERQAYDPSPLLTMSARTKL